LATNQAFPRTAGRLSDLMTACLECDFRTNVTIIPNRHTSISIHAQVLADPTILSHR
jgi:hypothetical protein